ncbi:type II secretion system pilot lipoprotein GspS-beta [Photobacterium sp. DNB23_23_1]|uniref:GspS/AspS pilotin family protein n=1 Tax=Photobacterium pectinilyticum TaxID=2906793 RepID=A0ABT1N682_9GAMM|nr:type II secretion system pilot lipoprotein GspS-beta [Photobacterium sp. ZSDE20]MCQ1060253.1 GspS/AspS pilotin family protein [Photobacterium sp. ZSDE20]MDD1827455.1 GspS/AspS pilotin family protein [Photobacterium sp. ZSDE20]
MLKRTLVLLAAVLLAGCASNKEEQAIMDLAKARAMAINNKAPYKKIDQYQIMKAQAREKTVEITILYGGGGNTPPTKAAKSAAVNYCNNEDLSPLVSEGVSYNIVIIDMRGRPMVTQPITAEVCSQIAN